MKDQKKDVKDPRAELLARHLPDGGAVEDELALLASQPDEKQKVVEKRLHVLDEYLRIKKPTTQAVDAAASEIGIARRRFYRLIANLQKYGPVRSLTPGFRKVDRAAPSRDGLSNEIEAAIAQTLAHDPDASLASIEAQVRDACEAAETPAPNKTAIRRRILAIRRSGANITKREPLGSRIVIDQIVIDLPVTGEHKTTMSVVTLVIDLGTRLILGGSIHAGDTGAVGLRSALADVRQRITAFTESDLLVAEHLSELTWIVPPGWEIVNAVGALVAESLPARRRPTIYVELEGSRRHGNAILRSIGDRLGVYHLRQSLPIHLELPPSDQSGMHIEDAARITAYSIDQWNDRLISHISESGMYRPNRARRLKRLSDDIETLFEPVFAWVDDLMVEGHPWKH